MRSRLLLLLTILLLRTAHVRADTAPRLYIPRIGLDAAIGECALVDGWHDTTQLGDGVCHLEGTATIEHEWARIVLAGHTPGAFDDLVYVEQGDQVMVWDAGAVEVYNVTFITVTTVDDTSWLMPTDNETLTLITCSGDLRLIVHAEKAG